MTVPEIYNIWKDQWQKEEFRSFGIHRHPEIAYTIRESGRTWNDNDIDIFSEYLNDKVKRKFVANLFGIQEQIPEQLFKPFIDAALKEDASANQDFINPCIRVFGLGKVILLLDEYYFYGDKQAREGVSKASYWVGMHYVHVIQNAKPIIVSGYIKKWNGFYYDAYEKGTRNPYKMNESELMECKAAMRKMIIQRRQYFIEQFFKIKDRATRHYIRLSLPDQLDEFYEENQDLAKVYLNKLQYFK